MSEQDFRGSPPGWYPDPWFTGQRRYFTGEAWTSDVFADGAAEGAGAAPIAPRGDHGLPPSTPAFPPPPAPQWGTDTPASPLSDAPTPPPEVLVPSEAARWGAMPRVVATSIAVVVLSLGALWLTHRDGSASSASASTTPSPAASQAPTPAPSGSPSAPADSSSASLENLVVRPQDVTDAYAVAPIPGGTKVEGEVTLDLCDAAYPSEGLRVERLQVVAVDSNGTTQLSTEAVRYESDAATAQAFDEVRSSAKDCPSAPVPDPSTGGTVSTTITGGVDSSWPTTAGVDRLAYLVTRTDDTGTENSTLVVYLRRGPLFIGVYFPTPSGEQMSVEGATTIPDIVTIFEKRLLNPPTDAPWTPGLDGGNGDGSGGGGIPA